MTPGERAALEGVLSALGPCVSVEIGTSKGGSLERISAHSDLVHAFDLVLDRSLTQKRFPNVTFHIGDSHVLLPCVLRQLTESKSNVDFVFVDGDHAAPGVRQDLEDLLSSPAVGQTVILVHDTLNERVRAGIEEIDYDQFKKVRLVDHDFIVGRIMKEGTKGDERWFGLGVVVTGREDLNTTDVWPSMYSAQEVYARFDGLRSSEGPTWVESKRQLLRLEEELALQRRLIKLIERSWSWRLTTPLRWLRQLIRRSRRN